MDSAGWQPSGQIQILAGTPEGGGQDRAARALTAALEATSDLSIEVTNIPGRGGGNAWDVLCTHARDGHRLSISSPTLITNRLTDVSDLELDALTQIAMLYSEYIMFAVPTSSPLQSAEDLIAHLASSAAPTISLATARGNINHIALAYLCRHAGIPPSSVPISVFNSAPLAIADALEDPTGIVAVSAASVVPEFRDGSLRLLAVSSPTRLSGELASAPTFDELGIDCTIGVWRGVFGPPSLSPEVVAFWADSIGRAVESESWHTSLERHVWAPSFLGPAATVDFIASEDRRMQTALSEFGLLD